MTQVTIAPGHKLTMVVGGFNQEFKEGDTVKVPNDDLPRLFKFGIAV